MEAIIQKAKVLIEALPYIQRFRGEIVVVKFGGSAMEEAEQTDSVLSDITFMECVGMRPVVVHGGGKAISRRMQKEGVETEFRHGIRITCKKTVDVVDNVLNEEINPGIVKGLTRHGARAKGLRGQDVFSVKRKQGVDADTGEKLDWGLVGVPEEVEVGEVDRLVKADVIPVISPLGIGSDGNVHNINADTAAGAIASALRAAKLVFLTDVPGLLRDPKDESSIISSLGMDEVDSLRGEGIIDGGMLPKVESGVGAMHAGVGKVHMIDGSMPHSLLLEIFTVKGVGTQIVME
jgi:acetylglutamate kinase